MLDQLWLNLEFLTTMETILLFVTPDHTNEEYHEEINSAFEFITKLLRHLLPENFKSIRSYGVSIINLLNYVINLNILFLEKKLK